MATVSNLRCLAIIGLTILSACATKPVIGFEELPEFDTRDIYDSGLYTYTIATDMDEEFGYRLRFSKAADDVTCKKSTVYSSGSVSAVEPDIRNFGFSRMGSPHIALYEWHLCLIIDEITYKAWRGFDPGPGSTLEISCQISADQLANRDTDAYLCSMAKIIPNRANYGEFWAHCNEGEEDCRRFESEQDLNFWEGFNADPNLYEGLALAILQYDTDNESGSYIQENPWPIYLSIEGEDPSKELLDQLKTLPLDVYPGSSWEKGKGNRYSIGQIRPKSENSVTVVVSTYCGALCASGTIVTLERQNGVWRVVLSEMNWISQHNSHNNGHNKAFNFVPAFGLHRMPNGAS